jgi:hypothetical protein
VQFPGKKGSSGKKVSSASLLQSMSALVIEQQKFMIQSQQMLSQYHLQLQAQSRQVSLPLTSSDTRTGLDLIDSSRKSMLLNAGIRPDGVIPQSPPLAFLDFVNEPKGTRRFFLESILQREFRCEIIVDQNMALKYAQGVLLADDPRSQHNALSVWYTADASDSPVERVNDALQEIKRESQLLTQKEATKSTKSVRVVPKTWDEALRQLKNFGGLIEFFFGAESEISVRYTAFYDRISLQRKNAGVCVLNIKDFLLCLLHEVDSVVSGFLQDCFDRADDPSRVDVKILDFDDIARAVSRKQAGYFSQPAWRVAELAMDGSIHGEENGQGASPNGPTPGGGRKKGKKRQAEPGGPVQPKPVKNPQVNPNWKIDASEFAEFQSLIGSVPKAGGAGPICAKYQLVGVCHKGDQCDRKATHFKLTGRAKREFNQWFDQAQEQRAGAQQSEQSEGEVAE